MQSSPLPVFSIVGTTSVGKSETVFSLAQYSNEHKIAKGVSILSADSRQVYTGLETLTGADIPAEFTKVTETRLAHLTSSLQYPYFSNVDQENPIDIYGVSLLSPTEEWSVGLFNEYARAVYAKTQREGKVLLVVGGTGLYHEHLFTTDPRLFIPPQPELRAELESKSVLELQEILAKIAPTHLENMNNSDRNNPRRLLRAIEVEKVLPTIRTESSAATQASQSSEFSDSSAKKTLADSPTEAPKHVYLGLHLSAETLQQRIATRVADRFKNGAVAEVRAVLESGKTLTHQAMTTLGFAEIQKYLNHEVSEQECMELWTQADYSYSKRQLTWWKKYGAVTWFEKESPTWQQDVLNTFLQQHLS